MKKFLKFSKLLGQSPALVQGAGGNTSVKIGKQMFVKASGYFLKDIDGNKGYVCSNYKKIQKYISNLKKYHTNFELPFNQLAKKSLAGGKSFGEPSIEIGLHAVIASKYVFHTHSVLANVLNFSGDGETMVKKIFGDNMGFIIYKNPGLELAFALSKQKKLPNIIFLKNHGLITHHNNADIAYELTLDVQKNIVGYLKKQKVYRPFVVTKKSANFKRHMFPDSVVYNQVDFKKLPAAKKQVYYQICSMVNYTQRAIRLLKLQPAFLPESKVNFLVNMEQEKHRINKFIND